MIEHTSRPLFISLRFQIKLDDNYLIDNNLNIEILNINIINKPYKMHTLINPMKEIKCAKLKYNLKHL